MEFYEKYQYRARHAGHENRAIFTVILTNIGIETIRSIA